MSDADWTKYLQDVFAEAYARGAEPDTVGVGLVNEYVADVKKEGFSRATQLWVGVLIAELAHANHRVADLEARKGFRWQGPFREGHTYSEDDFVTHAGSIYRCNFTTTEQPGRTSSAWTLAVRAGRDGTRGAR